MHHARPVIPLPLAKGTVVCPNTLETARRLSTEGPPQEEDFPHVPSSPLHAPSWSFVITPAERACYFPVVILRTPQVGEESQGGGVQFLFPVGWTLSRVNFPSLEGRD